MSELKPRHTLLPWGIFVVHPTGVYGAGQRGNECFSIAPDEYSAKLSPEKAKELAEANTALIVHRVNAHEGLVEALELAEIWLMQCIPIVEIDGPKPLPVIRAALAQAKGGE